VFNKDYFDSIWGTLHRHDYCDSLANQLIQKYGKCRILDIGTGCGYLVKTLREKGCDAWGLDISQYAVDNSCAPHYIRLGSVTDIPFASGFNVVHSQGLWEYVAEDDIQKAWSECKRVGKNQWHNYDTLQDQAQWSKDFITHKSDAWWKNQFYPKVLVACPNHFTKEYSFQRWINTVKALTYPNYDILVVDNSPTDDFMNRWNTQVPMKRIDTTGMEALMVKRLNYSYEQIRLDFLAGDYSRLMVIESDIIPPKDVIERLLEVGKNADWISHAYPSRGQDHQEIQGLGCSLFTQKLMEKYGFKSLEDNILSDGGLWQKVRPDKDLQTLELWNYMTIQHLMN
jgi:hypothetical protein